MKTDVNGAFILAWSWCCVLVCLCACLFLCLCEWMLHSYVSLHPPSLTHRVR